MSEQVRLMFSEISGSYDLGNDVVSVGMHRSWKRQFVEMAGPKPGDSVLDVATGTGDIAALFAAKVGERGEVVGVDFSEAMIEQARRRAKKGASNVRFLVADALDLPFADRSFEIATISYGIRNVDDPVAGLSEMRRVVKPGGRVCVLETGQPSGLLAPFIRLYCNVLLPFVGGIVTGNRTAYSYLNRTASSFPCGERFMEMMREAGIHKVKGMPLLGGIAWIYIGVVE